MYLFSKDISNWVKWGEVFQDIDSFKLLIKHIFMVEGIPLLDIRATTPGTNAVFHCGRYVVKIYAPLETGISGNEYRRELEALRRASRQNIPSPKITACGMVADKYEFYYLITEKVLGAEATNIITNYSYDDKFSFVQKLNKLLSKINTRAPLNEKEFKSGLIHNKRWSIFPPPVQKQIKKISHGMSFRDMVYVHGDLTGENVLLNKDKITLIDFGDSKIAPVYYEYPPIIYELFNHDKTLSNLFAQGKIDFVEDLFIATILHDFGALFVKDICRNHLKIKPSELEDIYEIKKYIRTLG
jgi:serine/threonine protein kinase